MIIKILLSIGLGLVFLFAVMQESASRLVSRFMYLFTLTGIYFVWLPSHAAGLADALGVGRGVDLIFYSLFILGVFAIFTLYLKIKELHEIVTDLTRRMALSRPSIPKLRDDSDATVDDKGSRDEGR